ncbi:MAG: type III secretion HpaP family protein, partial [Puniceicoccales bacterium]|nr:type III secretion HpaP family protein [Puniceicoccales bacterium]
TLEKSDKKEAVWAEQINENIAKKDEKVWVKSEAQEIKTQSNMATNLSQIFKKFDEKEGTSDIVGAMIVGQQEGGGRSNIGNVSTAKMAQMLGKKENETFKTSSVEVEFVGNISEKKTIENATVEVKKTQNIAQKKGTLNQKLEEDVSEKTEKKLLNKTEPMPLPKKTNEEKSLTDITKKSEGKLVELEEGAGKETEKKMLNRAESQLPIEAVLGEKILANIAEKSDSQSIEAAAPIVKIGNEIVERIMLIQAVGHAKQEVVIAFKDTVLPGTQLSLTREGSTIHLDFFATNSQSFEFLAANHSGLQTFLLERLSDVNVVNIEVKEGNIDHTAPREQRQKHQRESQKDPKNEENPEKS